MSDDNGEAPVEDLPGDGPDPAGALEAPLDPALGARLDTMHRTLSTLGMRIDALVTSTTTYRTALTDRLTEYADLVTKLTRTQAADLEEYRRASERVVADLRRGLANSEEILERVGARIDSMVTDAESTDDQSRRVLGEVRSILDAQENLSRFLTESLDSFGDRVMERISASQAATAEQLEAMRTLLGDGGRDDAIADRLSALDARLSSFAEQDPAAAVAGHLDTLHSAVELLATADQVSGLAAEVRRQLADVVGAEGDTTVMEKLSRIERDLAGSTEAAGASSGELAGLRAKVDAILESSSGESSAVAELLDEVRETLLDVASGEVLGALWDEFRDARRAIDEVLVGVQRTEEAASAVAERTAEATDDRFEGLRADVRELNGAVRDLLEQAEVVDAPEPDGMLTAIASDVSTLRRELSQGLVVEPSDALSGAVDQLRTDVGALDTRLEAIDELRRSIDELRAAPAPTGPEPDADRDAVAEVVEPQLRSLRDSIASLDERLAVLDELRDTVAALGTPADAAADGDDEAAAELRSMRDDLAVIGERMDSVGELHRAVTTLGDELRAALAEQRSQEAPALDTEDLEGELATLRTGVDGVTGELRTIRSGVEDVIARLDEGLVLSDDVAPPAAGVAPELDDQLASIRDQLSTEFDALRRLVEVNAATEAEPSPAEAPDLDLSAVTERLDALAAGLEEQRRTLADVAAARSEEPAAAVDLTAVTELLEHLRDDLAELPDRIDVAAPEAAAADTGPAYAALDPDVVDLLREEIRAAGAIPDDLLDQLRKELISLRRRIKLRAEGELLTDEQLEAIADAVARKLAT